MHKAAPQIEAPWLSLQSHLKATLSPLEYTNWIAPIARATYKRGVLTLTLPDAFHANWIQSHFALDITAYLTARFPKFTSLSLAVDPATAPIPPPDDADADPHPDQPARPAKPARLAGFDPRFTFADFIQTPDTSFAYNAAHSLATTSPPPYSPFTLYGPSGTGKTHLAQAIAHEIHATRPQASVVYTSAEGFTNALVDAIAHKTTPRFRSRLRAADVLIFDGLQFLSGKDASQSALLHTISALLADSHLVIFCSDRHPAQLPGISNPLASRLTSGLITQLPSPSTAAAAAILRAKASHANVPLPDDVVLFLAEHAAPSITQLESALITLIAYHTLQHSPITLDTARFLFADLIAARRRTPPTIPLIQRAVAREYRTTPAALCSHDRHHSLTTPRHVAMYLARTMIPSASLNAIGDAFAGKDHSTVLYAIKRITAEYAADPDLHATVDRIATAITAATTSNRQEPAQ